VSDKTSVAPIVAEVRVNRADSVAPVLPGRLTRLYGIAPSVRRAMTVGRVELASTVNFDLNARKADHTDGNNSNVRRPPESHTATSATTCEHVLSGSGLSALDSRLRPPGLLARIMHERQQKRAVERM